MPRKQSLLYDRMNMRLCSNAHFGYTCDTCEYTIKDERLLCKFAFADMVSIIESIIVCEKDENMGIDPRSIIISCRGAVIYKAVAINSNIKLSTNAELSKCIIDMWISICPFASDKLIMKMVRSLKKTINNCTSYQSLSNSIWFIVQNFEAWSTGSVYIETQDSNNSYAA